MRSATLLVCLLALAGSACADSAKNELCNQVAVGSQYSPDKDQECVISCYLSYVGLFHAHLDWGTSCDNGRGRCALGDCRAPGYKPPMTLHNYEIRINEALVTRADEVTGSESDPFVVVSLVRGSSATFPRETRLCRTPTIWQEANPKWNFSCREVVLEPSAVLRFSVYDADTIRAELLGEVTKKVSELADDGETQLILGNSYRRSLGQTLTVELVRRPFRPAGETLDGCNGRYDRCDDDGCRARTKRCIALSGRRPSSE